MERARRARDGRARSSSESERIDYISEREQGVRGMDASHGA